MLFRSPAEAATIRPEGFARLDAGRFAAADPAVAAAALAALLRAVGGHEQPVRVARVAALLARLWAAPAHSERLTVTGDALS